VVKLRIHLAVRRTRLPQGLYSAKTNRAPTSSLPIMLSAELPRSPVQSVNSSFTPAPDFSAAVFENYDGGLDLGSCQQRFANLPPDLSKIQRRDPRCSYSRHRHPAGGVWTVCLAMFENENASVTDVHRFINHKDESLGKDLRRPVWISEGAFSACTPRTTRRYGCGEEFGYCDSLKAWASADDQLSEPPSPTAWPI